MTFQEIIDEVAPAREAYRRGVPPSQIARALLRRGWGMHLVALAREAFGLSIAEAKNDVGFVGRKLVDDAAFDAYFIPLIEAHRAEWDEATSSGRSKQSP